MDDIDRISADEFRALRLLHADERAPVSGDIARRLFSRRLAKPTSRGWSLTAAGRAEHLCELIRSFNQLRLDDPEPAGGPRGRRLP